MLSTLADRRLLIRLWGEHTAVPRSGGLEAAVMTPVDLGDRLRVLRKLHRLTQQELADLSGASKSLISKVEAGHRPGSWDLAVRVANALGVEAPVLMGLAPDERGIEARMSACLPPLRQMMVDYDLPRARPPVRSLGELAHETERAGQLRLNSRYVALGEMLPALLEDLLAASFHARGADQDRVYWLLAAAYRCADAIAHKLGHLDLSLAAIERVRWAAERSRDELMIATASYVRSETFFVTGSAESGLVLLESAADRIATKVMTDRRAASVYGALHARAAVLAAFGGHTSVAWSNLKIAKMMVDAVDGDVEHFHTSFGAASVKVHEVAAAVELRDGAEAVHRAAGWTPPVGLPAERASHFFIDLARAQIWAGDPAGAVASLLEARRRAPQHTRTNPGTREVVTAVLGRAGRSTDAVLGLATWLGVPY
ncbi:helix-turn-helix domain-containing protein [Actinocorallia populi]|uniref:helix-turn-helix domain-containing protein n=1 Tax=Actinocorallia populi TaxID=2079200 RepID=UPI0013001EB5|nr:helix-turn-helix domain-containing protein [Actinocorallia populi]